jgi:hypothetical protein
MAELSDKALAYKVREQFDYVDGTLVSSGTKDDKSWKGTRGYRCIYFNGETYLLHRLIFLYFHDFFPQVVDHIDGDVYNNRIENLQACNQKVNIEKAKIFNTNKTGFKGVSYHQAAGKYEAYFWKNYEKIYCGLHATAEEAHKAREERKYAADSANKQGD